MKKEEFNLPKLLEMIQSYVSADIYSIYDVEQYLLKGINKLTQKFRDLEPLNYSCAEARKEILRSILGIKE